jgi:hypothetical protein
MNSDRLIQILNLLPFDRRRQALIDELMDGCEALGLDPEKELHIFVLRTLTSSAEQTKPKRQTLRDELPWILETGYEFRHFDRTPTREDYRERAMEFCTERGGVLDKTVDELSPRQYGLYRKLTGHVKDYCVANHFTYLGIIPPQHRRKKLQAVG